VVHLPVVVACKPMWQNMWAYQTVTNNSCPHVNAWRDILSISYIRTLSAIAHKLNVSGNMYTWKFYPVLVREIRVQNLSGTYSYISVYDRCLTSSRFLPLGVSCSPVLNCGVRRLFLGSPSASALCHSEPTDSARARISVKFRRS
jgi:hypothetical protein